MQITSTNNPMVKTYRALRDKKGRATQGLFLVEGVRLITDALDSGVRIEKIFYDFKREALRPLVKKAESQGIECIEASEKVIDVLSDTDNPQGVVAVCQCFELSFTPQGKRGELLVALDGLKDPGNIGTIIRTAEAAGVGAIYVSPHCVQRYNPKLIRSTMGAFFRQPIFFDCDLSVLLSELKEKGYRSVAAALGGEDFYARTTDDTPKILIIGSEAEGISKSLLGEAESVYELPILGKAESLNAAIAAGIMIYDLKMRG